MRAERMMRAMELGSLHYWVSTEFEYPVSKVAVEARAGAVEIEGPDPKESETISTILQRTSENEFLTPMDLVSAIMGNLGEQYVGRKYYDDRGWNPSVLERELPRDTTNTSF